ncbi:hypothetical protein BZA70DRAFT_274523 [Myxozyma melibiosi]|uniref:SIS domain-containing protein n=1 Tax=Myxozyma melibiosi TaxID=54550 RepID=A0ABR1F9U5_9ASCO
MANNLLTPPGETSPSVIMASTLTMLKSQALTLSHLSNLYTTDSPTQSSYISAIQIMHNSLLSGGKIILVGMGKSGKIADKLCATMNSLCIHATTLHPCDALHGDLGVVRPGDVLFMITASGATPEILQLLPHVPASLPRILLTCKPDSVIGRMSQAVVSAAIPHNLNEREIYGVPAPTTTTTACLAVGDAICITLAEIITAEQEERKQNFGRYHPGGAIGNTYKDEKAEAKPTYKDVMILWTEQVGQADETDELSILRAAAGRRWVCVGGKRLLRSTEIAGRSSFVSGLPIAQMKRVEARDVFDESNTTDVLLVVRDHAIVGVYEP